MFQGHGGGHVGDLEMAMGSFDDIRSLVRRDVAFKSLISQMSDCRGYQRGHVAVSILKNDKSRLYYLSLFMHVSVCYAAAHMEMHPSEDEAFACLNTSMGLISTDLAFNMSCL